MEQKSFTGKWSLPNSTKEISGVLEFHPQKGGSLSLHGSFRSYSRNTRSNSYAIIHGVANDGTAITLCDCFITKFNFSQNNVTLYVNEIYVGHHFRSYQEIKFQSVNLYLQDLYEWTNVHGFRVGEPDFKENKVAIHYTLPKSIECQIENQFKLEIAFSYLPPSTSVAQKKATITQETFFRITSPRVMHFDEYKENLPLLQDLITMATGRFCFIVKFTGKASRNPHPVEVLFPQRNIYGMPKRMHFREMFFNYHDIKSEFGLFMNNWFQVHKKFRDVFNLYTDVLSRDNFYDPNRFLNIAQAIETYHRRKYNGKYQDPEDFTKEVQQILVNAIPREIHRDFREKLKKTIEFANEYSLRKRLKELIELSGEKTKWRTHKHLIGNIVDTRNYYTHYGSSSKLNPSSSKSNPKKGIELIELTETLNHLLEICLYKDLNLPENVYKNIISSKRKNEFLKLS